MQSEKYFSFSYILWLLSDVNGIFFVASVFFFLPVSLASNFQAGCTIPKSNFRIPTCVHYRPRIRIRIRIRIRTQRSAVELDFAVETGLGDGHWGTGTQLRVRACA